MTPDISWRRLRWSLIVLAVAITPIDFGEIGLISAGGPDMIKWALRFPIWYLPLALVAPRWGPMLEAFRRPPTAWLLAWAALGSISVIWAVTPEQAVLVGLGVAGLALLATWHVFSCGWSSFATAAVTGLTVVVGMGMIVDLMEGVLGSERSGGITTGPTTHARLAALNIVIAAGLLWSKRYGPQLWVAPIISVAALTFSETRTAMIAALVGVLYGGLRRLSRLYRWLTLGGIIIGGMCLFIVASSFSSVGDLGERGDPTSVSGRTSIWPVAIDLIAERPLLGHGMGSEERVFIQAASDGDLTFLAGTTHSIVLSPLLSGGVVGFSLFAIAVGSAAKHRKRVDAWVFAPVLAILVGGLTEAIVHIPSVSVLILSACLAAIARSPRWPDRVTVEQGPTRLKRRLAEA